MPNPRPAQSKVTFFLYGFVRPSLDVLCSENILHTDNLSLFS